MPDATAAGAADFDKWAIEMRKVSFGTRILVWLFDDPQFRIATRFLRRFLPILKTPSFWMVSRYDDVMEVLKRDADFPVPFKPKFELMDRKGTNFVLGMSNDPAYRAIHTHAMQAFRLEDMPSIAKFSFERAEALVAAGDGVIDAMAGLCSQVSIDIIGRYYGIPAQNPDLPLWLFAMNYNSFPHPPLPLMAPDKAVEPTAVAAAANCEPLVDAAVARAKTEPPDDTTILGRLVAAQQTDPDVLTDDVLRATIVGFMLGFAPTNNRAFGQILQCLLRHPDIMAVAEAAAKSGDDDLLSRVLFEALRFMPINPGPFRNVAADTVIAAGQPHATKVPKGALVMLVAQSASYDPRRVPHPEDFDTDRSLADTMRFGWGQHFCTGYRIAIVQITQTFKPLLLRGNIRRAVGKPGQPGYFGLFYEHLHVTYGD